MSQEFEDIMEGFMEIGRIKGDQNMIDRAKEYLGRAKSNSLQSSTNLDENDSE